MGRIITFYVPHGFQPKAKSPKLLGLGKLIEFRPAQTTKPA